MLTFFFYGKKRGEEMVRGARGKYHEWLTKEGLTLIEGWARDGLIDEQIAANIGITTTTLYDWKKKYSDFSDALKRGKESSDYEVENALFKSATGYEYEERKEVQEVVDGVMRKRVEVTRKQVPPNATSAIFWLKNRKPDKWRNKQEIEISKVRAEIKKLEAETARIESQSDGAEAQGTVVFANEDDIAD